MNYTPKTINSEYMQHFIQEFAKHEQAANNIKATDGDKESARYYRNKLLEIAARIAPAEELSTDSVILNMHMKTPESEHYPVPQHGDCYFIVRHSLYSDQYTEQRVCLYRTGVVNKHLFGSLEPGTQLLANELRNGRTLKQLTLDMVFKCD